MNKPNVNYFQKMRELVLPKVQKPARYLGNEWNQINKHPEQVKTRMVLAFPDVYEIGISYLGFQILYELLNQEAEVYAERVYSPWQDAEALLREHNIPLCSLETATPLNQFQFVGITLQHEMSYTNVLNLLDLAHIPLESKDRREGDPLVIGGGPCSSNPEPIAEAFDLLVLGDGEEVLLEIIRLEATLRLQPRREKIRQLSQIPGVYAPSRYTPVYTPGGELVRIEAEAGAPYPVRRRVAQAGSFPMKPLVPYLAITHDRANTELFRGCTRGCRFCQAGMITRPIRERDPQTVLEQMLAAVASSGYEEISVTSLSSGDYSQLIPLVNALMQELAEKRVALSFPSLRLDSFRRELAEAVRLVRKTGLTFAPEAGSQRMRNVINKNLDEAELLANAGKVFEEGWDSIKLYFMVGLPTETEADVLEISRMVREILVAGRKSESRTRSGRVNLSVNLFIPKPHTPFQWEAQLSREVAKQRLQQLAQALPRSVGFFFGKRQAEDLDRAYLEAVLARGDRRLWPVIKQVWEQGARFDSWGDLFQFSRWQQAFKTLQVNPDEYALRTRPLTEVLPWSHLHLGVDPEFLIKEWEAAVAVLSTPDCRQGCNGCGLDTPAACPPVTAPPLQVPKKSITLPNRPEREKVRYRIRYAKQGDLRFVGHLDLVNLFRRAARRAQLPLHYSIGFHPQPSLAFGPPLPLGYQATGEWLDLGLDSWMEPQDIMQRWNLQLPEGIRVESCREVPLSTAALAQQIQAGEYLLQFPGRKEICDRILQRQAVLLQAEEILVEQWSKNGVVKVNLRPVIVDLELISGQAEGIRLKLVHATLPQASAKVSSIVEYLAGPEMVSAQVMVTRVASGKLFEKRVVNP